jgi:hypothetical protein
MKPIITALQIVVTEHFNDEVIWDNSKDLFSQYFKKTIFDNRYRLAIFDLQDNLDFGAGLVILNSI